MVSHYVYILECADNTLYVGYTTNLEARRQDTVRDVAADTQRHACPYD